LLTVIDAGGCKRRGTKEKKGPKHPVFRGKKKARKFDGQALNASGSGFRLLVGVKK